MPLCWAKGTVWALELKIRKVIFPWVGKCVLFFIFFKILDINGQMSSKLYTHLFVYNSTFIAIVEMLIFKLLHNGKLLVLTTDMLKLKNKSSVQPANSPLPPS